MSSQCKWILKTGPYAGKVCGNNCFREFCSQHNKLYSNSLRRTSAIQSLISDGGLNPIFNGINAHCTPLPCDQDQDQNIAAQTGAGPNKYEKHKWSVYLITINSQKDATKMTPEDQAKFKSFIDKNVLTDGVFKYFEDKKSPDVHKNIIKVMQDGKYEIGEQQGRLHFHGIIRIEHTGLLQFHANKLRNDAKAQLGYPIYLASPVSSDPIAAYQQYFEKKLTTAP